MKKPLAMKNLLWLTKNISVLSLIYLLTALSPLRGQSFTGVDFGMEGARWYYKNSGKDKEHIKNIYIESVKDTMITYYVNGKDTVQDTVSAHILLLNYLDKDSVLNGRDTVIICSNYYYSGDNRGYTNFYSKEHSWINLYVHNDLKLYANSPFIAVNKTINYFPIKRNGNNDCAIVKGDTLQYVELAVNPNFCDRYQTGNILERIGSLFYMFPTDTCKKDTYGGELLWYEDPEFGRFTPMQDSIVPIACHPKDTTPNGIFIGLKPEDDLKIFPQPFQDILHIRTELPLSNIEIYNIQGKLISSNNILHTNSNSSSIEWNTENWKCGLYLIKMKTNNSIQIYKILKL